MKFDTGKSSWSIVYFEGLKVIISKNNCITFSEDQFEDQIISSVTSLFAKVPVCRHPECKLF